MHCIVTGDAAHSRTMQCTPAGGLRYNDKTTTHLVVEAGGTWSWYAPGDHSR
jgi:hypothetical protein